MTPPESRVRDVGADPEALETFYLEHLPLVRTYLARRVTDPHAVADLTADVFVRAIESAHRYRADHGPPAAWLTGIARNTVRDHLRRSARERTANRRIDARPLLDDDSLARVADRVDAQKAARDLLAAVARLPRGQRDVVELVAVDGLPLVDAARLLGISPGTARVRYHRARRALSTPSDLTEVTS